LNQVLRIFGRIPAMPDKRIQRVPIKFAKTGEGLLGTGRLALRGQQHRVPPGRLKPVRSACLHTLIKCDHTSSQILKDAGPRTFRIRAKARERRGAREPWREGIGLRLLRRYAGYIPCDDVQIRGRAFLEPEVAMQNRTNSYRI